MSLTLTYGALNLTASPYLIEFGLDTGAPQNVSEALAFLLQDGEVELSSRTSNRTLQFNVLIEGANLLTLATAEAALVAETEKVLNTLTVDPGDSGPVAVYSIFRGQVTLARDDDGETARLRRYSVTVRAYPSVRSVAEVNAPTLPASGTTTTLVDNGSATTNWTGTTNGGAATVAVVSGAVGVTTASLAGTVTIALTRTASITTSSTKFLVVDWKAATATPSASSITAYGDGTLLAAMGSTVSPTAGFTRSYFYVAASSIAALRLDSVSVPVPGKGGTPGAAVVRTFHVDNIDRTDVRPAVGTARQLVRAFEVAGSARSPGTISVEHASSSLGDALVYCWPTGVNSQSPPLRQYRVSGTAPTVDATMVSGSREQLVVGTTTFRIPINFVLPGNHLLVGRLRGAVGAPTTGNPLVWTATTVLNSVNIGPTVTGSWSKVIPATTFGIHAIGRMVLPTRDLDPATPGYVQIALDASATVNAEYDEVWLFNTSVGQVVQVSCGTAAPSSGGSANRLFIEPATVERPRPSVRVGFAADRSDSFYPITMDAWMFPTFEPGEVNVFTVTTNALDASVSLLHYPHWHTHPGS